MSPSIQLVVRDVYCNCLLNRCVYHKQVYYSLVLINTVNRSKHSAARVIINFKKWNSY